MEQLKQYVETVMDKCSDNPKVVAVGLVVLGVILIVSLA